MQTIRGILFVRADEDIHFLESTEILENLIERCDLLADRTNIAERVIYYLATICTSISEVIRIVKGVLTIDVMSYEEEPECTGNEKDHLLFQGSQVHLRDASWNELEYNDNEYQRYLC